MDDAWLVVTGGEKEVDSRHGLVVELTCLSDGNVVGGRQDIRGAPRFGWRSWVNGCAIDLHEEGRRRTSLEHGNPGCSPNT